MTNKKSARTPVAFVGVMVFSLVLASIIAAIGIAPFIQKLFVNGHLYDTSGVISYQDTLIFTATITHIIAFLVVYGAAVTILKLRGRNVPVSQAFAWTIPGVVMAFFISLMVLVVVTELISGQAEAEYIESNQARLQNGRLFCYLDSVDQTEYYEPAWDVAFHRPEGWRWSDAITIDNNAMDIYNQADSLASINCNTFLTTTFFARPQGGIENNVVNIRFHSTEKTTVAEYAANAFKTEERIWRNPFAMDVPHLAEMNNNLGIYLVAEHPVCGRVIKFQIMSQDGFENSDPTPAESRAWLQEHRASLNEAIAQIEFKVDDPAQCPSFNHNNP